MAESRNDQPAATTESRWCETCGQPRAIGHRCPVVAKVRYGDLPFEEVSESGFQAWVENMRKGGSGCARPIR